MYKGASRSFEAIIYFQMPSYIPLGIYIFLGTSTALFVGFVSFFGISEMVVHGYVKRGFAEL